MQRRCQLARIRHTRTKKDRHSCKAFMRSCRDPPKTAGRPLSDHQFRRIGRFAVNWTSRGMTTSAQRVVKDASIDANLLACAVDRRTLPRIFAISGTIELIVLTTPVAASQLQATIARCEAAAGGTRYVVGPTQPDRFARPCLQRG